METGITIIIFIIIMMMMRDFEKNISSKAQADLGLMFTEFN